ncbi:unnamed protein product [Lymnaea stagnalis]|uniref:C2H2-type domain-containing protein n=1 Tax=Lymnaea stagnalis TaxID=6523 RepID=A0AAV2H8R8_LYMST
MTTEVQDHLPCPHCKAEFSSSTLRQHLSQIHGHDMPFQCTLCGKGFYSVSGLNHHKRKHAGQTFLCPICDTTFTQKSKVKRHLRSIHGCIPCSTCPGIFRVGQEYDLHVLCCPDTHASM